jgi:hypothetical protein
MGAEPSFKLRAWLFFYSNANMAGCTLALVGPALLFAGWIGPGWWAITAGLYAAGYALGTAVGRAPELEREIAGSLTVEDTLDHLDTLIRRVQPQLPAEMNQHLASVRASVAEVLPKLVGAQSHDADLYTVRETVLRYLPETLANYVALPPAFRISQPLKEGKTARELLGEQLALLDEQLQQVVANVARADAQALLANGQFLEMKFRQPDFLAP